MAGIRKAMETENPDTRVEASLVLAEHSTWLVNQPAPLRSWLSSCAEAALRGCEPGHPTSRADHIIEQVSHRIRNEGRGERGGRYRLNARDSRSAR